LKIIFNQTQPASGAGQIQPVIFRASDAQGLAQFARPRRQLMNTGRPAQPAIAPHIRYALQWLQRA
jgi:hypothetical protein